MIVKSDTVTQCSAMKLGNVYKVISLILVCGYILAQFCLTEPPFVLKSEISRLWICAAAFLAGGLMQCSSYLRLIPT